MGGPSLSVVGNVVDIQQRRSFAAEVKVADGCIASVEPVDDQPEDLSVAWIHRRSRSRGELDAGTLVNLRGQRSCTAR